MNTINHALWGTTIGRIVGLPVEGALIASLPDLLTVPVFGYYLYQKNTKPEKSPKRLRIFYEILHNWFVAIIIMAILSIFSRKLGFLGLGYLWHVIQDAFLHKEMASRFLWPVWKGKIQIFSANENKWFQILDLIVIVFINILLSKLL